MNDNGAYPRGYVMNADITKIEEVVDSQWGEQKRYRLYFKNPKVINTGNTNIKFKNNPVCYINC